MGSPLVLQRTHGRSRRAAFAPPWILALVTAAATPVSGAGQDAGPPLEGREAETFLQTARVVLKEPLGVGITHSDRLTLDDGTRKVRAVWKTINEHKQGLQKLENGASEFDFRDSYKAEVAAYELDKLLGLDLVPPTVERRIDGRVGSVQLWVEHAMTQADRKQKGLEPPDVDLWNQQMHKVRLLHQLTYNTDHQNIRNVLLDPSFRVYAVDSSRAFHVQVDLLVPGDLVRFPRSAVSQDGGARQGDAQGAPGPLARRHADRRPPGQARQDPGHRQEAGSRKRRRGNTLLRAVLRTAEPLRRTERERRSCRRRKQVSLSVVRCFFFRCFFFRCLFFRCFRVRRCLFFVPLFEGPKRSPS